VRGQIIPPFRQYVYEYLKTKQQSFQIIEPERTACRYGLSSVTSPEKTIRVAA
jgi:hypothetical protein